MTITRRTALGILAAAGALMLRPRSGFAAKPFEWRNGGFNPYAYRNEADQGFERALRLIRMDDERERDHFLNEFAARRVGEDRILERQAFDAMVFGKAEVYREVIAVPSAWHPSAPRTADVIFYNKKDVTVALVRPHVCGNWSRSGWPGVRPRCVPPG